MSRLLPFSAREAKAICVPSGENVPSPSRPAHVSWNSSGGGGSAAVSDARRRGRKGQQRERQRRPGDGPAPAAVRAGRPGRRRAPPRCPAARPARRPCSGTAAPGPCAGSAARIRSRSERQGGHELRRRRRLVAQDRGDRLRARRPRERAPAGHHLVEQRSEREHVAALVARVAGRLLGRHVAGGPEDAAAAAGGDRLRRRVGPGSAVAQQPRHAEVEHLDDTVRRQHHVRGLQVAVHDAGGVRVGDRVGEGGADAQRLEQRQGAALQHLGDGLARHELHHDEVRVVVALHRVDRHDVRVVERRGGAGLLQQPRAVVRIGGAIGRESLDRDLAVEAQVARPVDLAHAPAAEGGDHHVRSEPGTRRKRHGSLQPGRDRPCPGV